MSNNTQRDIDNLDIFNDFIGGKATPQPPQPQEVKEVKEDKEVKESKKVLSEVKPTKDNQTITIENYKFKDKTPNDKGEYQRGHNFTTTFKIDADIEQYLKNIDKITFIDSIKQGKADSKTATDYVNELIRADLKKRFKISEKETNPNKWIDAYNEYARENGIQDK